MQGFADDRVKTTAPVAPLSGPSLAINRHLVSGAAFRRRLVCFADAWFGRSLQRLRTPRQLRASVARNLLARRIDTRPAEAFSFGPSSHVVLVIKLVNFSLRPLVSPLQSNVTRRTPHAEKH